MLCERFEWPSVTYCNECCVAPLSEMCLFLHLLSTPKRWFDLEKKFGLSVFQLSKLFLKHAKLCVKTFGYAFKPRTIFICSGAALYASTLVKKRSSLKSLIAFIDRKKI